MAEKKTRAIGEMYLAAAYLAYGCELVDIDRTDPRNQKFYFAGCPSKIYILNDDKVERIDNPSVSDVEQQFISQKLMLPPSYPSSLRSIKSAIHSV